MTRTQYIADNLNKLRSTRANNVDCISVIAGLVYDSLKPKGSATGAAINALTGTKNGDSYRVITTGATLTKGALVVIVGDTVWYDETASVWKLL